MPDSSLGARFARQIKSRRKKLDWNQAKLAKQAGCSASYLCQIEGGTADPRCSMLEKIVVALKEGEKQQKVEDQLAGNDGLR